MNKQTQTNQQTIKNLLTLGFKVKMNTFRYSKNHGRKLINTASFRDFNLQNLIESKGGKICLCIIGDKHQSWRGEQICSRDDNFIKSEGIKRALNKAIENMKKDLPATVNDLVK